MNLYSQHYAIKSVELGDIEMSHILGKSAVYMDASRPEKFAI